MRPRHASWTLASVVLLTACRASVPEQVLSRPVPVPPAATPAAAAAGPWLWRPGAERRAYVVEHRAVLSIRQDTLTHIDTVSSRAELAFAAFAATRRIAGTVSVFRVQSAGADATTPRGLVTPFAFAAEYTAAERQLVFTAPNPVTPCAAPPLAVAQSLRDLWFEPPDTLRIGTAWQDSASYVVCRDGLPLRIAARRVFRVMAAAEGSGRSVLTLARSSHTTIEGEQAGETVSVSGSGNGDLTYAIDPATGEILSASGSSTLRLTLRSRWRTQDVRQTVETRIARGA